VGAARLRQRGSPRGRPGEPLAASATARVARPIFLPQKIETPASASPSCQFSVILTILHRSSFIFVSPQSLESQLVHKESRVERTIAEVNQCKQEQERLKTVRLVEADNEVKSLTQKTIAKEKEVIKFEEELHATVKVHFEKLSKELGIPDVRKHDLNLKREAEKGKQEEEHVQNVLIKLELEKKNTEAKLEQYSVARAAKEVEECEKELQGCKKELEKNEKQKNKQQKTRAEKEKRVQDLKAKESEFDESLREIREQLRDKKQDLLKVTKKLTSATAKAESAKKFWLELLRHSVLEQVNIPLLKGNIDQAITGTDGNLNANGNGGDANNSNGGNPNKKSKKKKTSSSKKKKKGKKGDGDEDEDDDGDASAEEGDDEEDAPEELEIDYSSLEDDRKNLKDLGIIKRVTAE
jgi:hypothetical protein